MTTDDLTALATFRARAMLRAERYRRSALRNGGTYLPPIVDLSRADFASLVDWERGNIAAEQELRGLEQAEWGEVTGALRG